MRPVGNDAHARRCTVTGAHLHMSPAPLPPHMACLRVRAKAPQQQQQQARGRASPSKPHLSLGATGLLSSCNAMSSCARSAA